MPVMILVLSSTNIAIVLIGGEYIAVGDMPVGNLVAFISYSSMLLFSFMMLSFMLTMIPQAQVSAKRINEVLAMESTITDGSKTFPTTDFTDESARLTFDDVTYKFHDAEKPVLCDVSFDMQAGETLAIIGGTGSGKSTMANLIMRLYDATTGSVYLNGENVKDLKQYDIRERISYVPQKANLFTGTIRTNMLDGKPDATDEEIWEALEIAQAKDFVEKLDGGLEYQVEQGGSNFSGGQRQRLSIARAIAKKSAVYVFDDSFSALDFKTDAALRSALKEKITDAVVVIIAQRISSVMTADEIIVLDSGRVVGQGSHEELVEENNETYMEIMNSQFREGDGQ